MAKQTETTSAAVWNPPRFRTLSARVIGNDGPRGPVAPIWEGRTADLNDHCTINYRMPTSAEPVIPGNLSPFSAGGQCPD